MMSARTQKRLMQQDTNKKLDELLVLSKDANRKIDRIGERVDNIDHRLSLLETQVGKVTTKAFVAGGLGGAIVTVGIELIKAKFGG